MTKHVEVLALHSARKVLWASGAADCLFDEHEAGAADRRKRSATHMESMRAARTVVGRGADYAQTHAAAETARAAKAARVLPAFTPQPLRNLVFNMGSA